MSRPTRPIRAARLGRAFVALCLPLSMPMLRPTPASASGPDSAATVVDQVVLVIGDRVVTASDVRIEDALRERVPWWSPPQPNGTSTLQVLADAALLRALAGDAALYVPDDDLVRERMGQLRDAFGDPESWRVFLRGTGLDEERLASLVRSRLIVERYIQRTLSLTARSEGASIEEVYAAWIPSQRGRLPVRVPAPISAP